MGKTKQSQRHIIYIHLLSWGGCIIWMDCLKLFLQLFHNMYFTSAGWQRIEEFTFTSFKVQFHWISICCRLYWNIIKMRKLELFLTIYSLCVSSVSCSWITSSLHPSWLCKERQPFLFLLQLTLENSQLFLDDSQSHFCPLKRKEEK